MSESVIQNITSIATLLTAAAALVTILEMRRQRISGYRPTIAIEDQRVNLYQPIERGSGRTIVFQPLGKLPTHETVPGSDVRFRVRNVGAGSALQVEAEWEFDAIDFAAVVAKADPEAGEGILVERGFIRFQTKDHGVWMVRQAQTHYLGTLPSSSDAQSLDVSLPFAYALFASTLFQIVISKGLDAAMGIELPSLTLSVSFRDRTAVRLESRYRIAFDLEFLAEGGSSIPECPGWANIGGGVFTVRPM